MSFFGKFQKVIGGVAVFYLRQKNLGTFLESVALTLDGAADGMLMGMRLGYPLRCPADQLPVIAFDRGISLYPTEPTASRRQRLRMWWQLHKARGSHQGEMRHTQPYFLPGALPTIRIVHQSGDGDSATWHTLDSAGNYSVHVQSPSNWSWDGQTEKWARWWAVIYMPPGTADGFDWDAGPEWDSGPLWDGVAAGVIADLYAMIRDWKAAHSWFAGLIVTSLQPGDDIPGFPGRHPFDPTDFPFTLADGHTESLPDDSWGSPVYTSGPNIGLTTRPPWATYYRIDNG